MSSVIPPSRDWMYKRLSASRTLIPAFIDGVMGFVEYASGRDEYRRNNNTMRCPCEKCKCKRHWKSSDDVTMDLMKSLSHLEGGEDREDGEDAEEGSPRWRSWRRRCDSLCYFQRRATLRP